MNKLRPSQMTILLTLSTAFSVMCAAFPFTLEQILGTAISIGVQILLCIPVLLLTKRNDSLAAHCTGHKILPLGFLLYLLISGGRSVVQLWNVSDSLSLPFSNAMLAAALIAAVCLYTSALGIQTLARSSTLVFGVLVLTLLVMLAGGYQSIHLQELSFSPDATIWQGFLQHLSLADELPVLVLLLSFLDKQPTKSTLRFFGLSLLIWSFVLFLGITILGNFMTHAPYPFFMIANVSQPFRTQRADALYLVVFVLLCILRLTLLTTLSAHLLGQAFPNLRCRSLICLLAMLVFAAILGIWNMASGWWYLVPIGLLTTIIPWGLLCCKSKTQQGNDSGKTEVVSS